MKTLKSKEMDTDYIGLPNDIVKATELQVLRMAENSGGICFTIVIQGDNEKYKLYDRPDQPCMGGELRKYKKTHKEDCTRPNDPRPNDLKHPFPKSGKPVGLGYKLNGLSYEVMPLVYVMLSDDSPWVKGFKSAEYIHYIQNPHYNPSNNYSYAYSGIVIKTGDFDPTVLVNLLRHLGSITTLYERWRKAKDAGLSDKEALFCACFFSHVERYLGRPDISETDSYMFNIKSSVCRFMNSETRDLTGGLWSERYDYNRPDMACVFTDEDYHDQVPFIRKVKNAMIVDQETNPYLIIKDLIQKELV